MSCQASTPADSAQHEVDNARGQRPPHSFYDLNRPEETSLPELDIGEGFYAADAELIELRLATERELRLRDLWLKSPLQKDFFMTNRRRKSNEKCTSYEHII